MKIGIGILTYNRPVEVAKMVNSIAEVHAGNSEVLVLDDKSRVPTKLNYRGINPIIYGSKNRGVAVRSNQLIRLLYEKGCNVIIIANDDLVLVGDALKFYAEAHQDTDIPVFCFRHWAGKDAFELSKVQNTFVTQMARVTGHWMSLRREVVERIGYMDTEYGRFGQEHVDYVYRANIAFGTTPINSSYDIMNSELYLVNQDVKSSIPDRNYMLHQAQALSYHRKKWLDISKVKIYQEYRDES